MDESTTRVLSEILQELKKLNEKLDNVAEQLAPLAAVTPLIERFAPALDNPAARWAMRRK